MAKEFGECNTNNILFLENSANIKEEFEDDGCIDIFETSISANETELKDNVCNNGIKEYKIASTVDDMKTELSSFEACNIVLNDHVKIENAISRDDIKIEFENNLLFCDNCDDHYEDYCTRCGMLAHILNGITRSATDDRAIKGIPNDILEIRESFGRVGVFALKIIPDNVRIGPFNGLSISESPWRLKGGKFIASEDKSKLLNWMQYINPARNIFQPNLIPFQRDDKLYYHTNREILVGEELLVCFGEKYEDSVNKDIEVDFFAPAEDDVKDVFACALCCLGFSSRGYLAKHKSTCPNDTIRKFSIDDFTQCPLCNIYFYEKEYLESHKPYCCETNVRKCISLVLDNQTVKVNKRQTQRLQMYKCTQCKYKTSYKSVLRSHLNKHYEVKMYRCEICSRQFKTKESLKVHMKYAHIDVPKDQKPFMKDYMKTNTEARSRYLQDKIKKCPKCKFQTKYKYNLETHIKTKHFKKYNYECEICNYKTNRKRLFQTHVKSKHLKQFSYECEKCDYKTNQKSRFEEHVKSKHLKQFNYECDICDYKTNYKHCLEAHVKSKHLKQFSYECEMCDYKTNQRIDLERHMKSRHLKQFSHECEMCNYKTNRRSDLERHLKSKYHKEFSFECETSDYKINKKSHFGKYVKLKQFSYQCEICNYKTSRRLDLETHVKSKHLKQFRYVCQTCDYKTNRKPDLVRHVNLKHPKEFSYVCEMCDYKTIEKSHFETHIQTKHLKQFSYVCNICDYETNQKQLLETHVQSKHLKV